MPRLPALVPFAGSAAVPKGLSFRPFSVHRCQRGARTMPAWSVRVTAHAEPGPPQK